ncbi:uncharacterized protein TNCV_4566391 [Trichonephila clavipes]|nr:uncharacterized protein TNCV_4566391 [Trichonephila clavipes]
MQNTKETQRNVSPSEQGEDERGPMPTAAIKDLLKKWEAVRAMVLEWHTNQADVSRDRRVTVLFIKFGIVSGEYSDIISYYFPGVLVT